MSERLRQETSSNSEDSIVDCCLEELDEFVLEEGKLAIDLIHGP